MHLILFISDTKEVNNINIKHWRPLKTKRNRVDFSLNVVYVSFSVGCFLFNPIKGFWMIDWCSPVLHHCVVICFGPQGSWSVHVCSFHLKMEFRSCARGRQWCGIIHYYWWTASIQPRLLFSRASCFMGAFPFTSLIFLPFLTNVFKYSNMFNTVLKRFYYVFQCFYKLLPAICNHNITLSCKHANAKYKFSCIKV